MTDILQTIDTMKGEAKLVSTENDKDFYQNDDIYTTKNGLYVIHHDNEHRVYKLKEVE